MFFIGSGKGFTASGFFTAGAGACALETSSTLTFSS
jgi:hypothetical protein